MSTAILPARQQLLKRLLKGNQFIGPILVALVLLSTQLSIKISSGASLGGQRTVNAAEVAFVLLTLAIAVRLVLRRGWGELDESARFLVKMAVVLALVWFTLVVCRLVLTTRLTLSVTVVMYLVFALVWYLVFRLGYLSKSAMLNGALIALTVVNLAGLWIVLVQGNRVRSAGLLSNINVYVGLVLLLTPVLLQYGNETRNRWITGMSYANIGIAATLVLLSGSRFALIGYPVELVLYFTLVAGGMMRRRLRNIALMIVGVGLLGGALILANPQLLGDLDRARSGEATTSADATTALATPSSTRTSGLSPSSSATPTTTATGASRTPISSPRTPGSTSSATTTPRPRPTPSAPGPPGPIVQGAENNPDYEPGTKVPQNLTHARVLKRSLEVASAHWLWGTGRSVIYFWGWGYHPPHNMFLEVLIYLGVFGAIPYFCITLFIPIQALKRLGKRTLSSGFLLGYSMLLGYSLLQPLITDQLIVLLAAWGLFGGLSGRGQTKWEQLVSPGEPG